MHTRHPLFPLTAAAIVVALAGCSPSGNPIDVPPAFAESPVNLGVDDGYSSGDWMKLTDDVPAITNLDDELRDALVRANADLLAERNVEILLVEGWRSENYQNQLFDEAVLKYGSEEEASRWVKRGAESKHVHGEAVDIATADAMDFLSRFGGDYGLCQVYANEAWHFELTADEFGVCPEQLVDGTAG